MAAKRSAAEMEQLRREFLVRAEAAFEQMFGADGQNALVTFTERENRACEVTDALARAAYLSEDDRAARFYDQRPPPAGGGQEPAKAGCMNGRAPKPIWWYPLAIAPAIREGADGRPFDNVRDTV